METSKHQLLTSGWTKAAFCVNDTFDLDFMPIALVGMFGQLENSITHTTSQIHKYQIRTNGLKNDILIFTWLQW